MNIAIVGAGAMGSAFGAGLRRAGHDVTLVDRNGAHVEAIRSRGLTLRNSSGEYTVNVAATTDLAEVTGADLALVLVDSNATSDVAPRMALTLAESGFVLTLQNGIGNVEALAHHLGPERVLGGSTYVSAAMIAPGHAHNTHVGETVLGEMSGGLTPRAEAAAELLSEAGFPTRAEANVMGHIWSKFALNCALNPLSAITGLRPGEVARHEDMAGLLDALIAEILAVVDAKGISLPDADIAEHIRRHAWARYNRPSMLQHIEAARATEIGGLNGALVREADALGLAVPVNRAITALVRGIEARARRGTDVDEVLLEALAKGQMRALD